MIGDLFNNNKRREVCTREGQVMYRGKKYAKDPSTGYYVCTSGERKRLHVVMWEAEHTGEYPEELKGLESSGYVIHHIDWNKSHNEISNLTCISVFGHELIHNPPKDKNKDKYKVEIVPGGVSKVININK